MDEWRSKFKKIRCEYIEEGTSIVPMEVKNIDHLIFLKCQKEKQINERFCLFK